MSLNDIATKLVELCRNGQNLEAITTLYADNARSIEAMGDDKMPREMQGKEAIIGKNQWWFENHEVHGGEVLGPYPHGDDRFACLFRMDFTPKAGGPRLQMEEAAVFLVVNDQIAEERFFYQMPAPT